MYYITSYDGQCFVKEINPKSDEVSDHLTVYEIKSEKCKGFSCSGKDFYFLDAINTITKLRQNKETKLFYELDNLFIKDKDKPNFKICDFSEIKIADKYLIH
jgi:hypothetical protein